MNGLNFQIYGAGNAIRLLLSVFSLSVALCVTHHGRVHVDSTDPAKLLPRLAHQGEFYCHVVSAMLPQSDCRYSHCKTNVHSPS